MDVHIIRFCMYRFNIKYRGQGCWELEHGERPGARVCLNYNLTQYSSTSIVGVVMLMSVRYLEFVDVCRPRSRRHCRLI